MIGLTPLQSRVLGYIRAAVVAKDGIMPTYDEIARGVGIKSKSGVAAAVNRLAERGHLKKGRRGARALELVNAPSASCECPHCGGAIMVGVQPAAAGASP